MPHTASVHPCVSGRELTDGQMFLLTRLDLLVVFVEGKPVCPAGLTGQGDGATWWDWCAALCQCQGWGWEVWIWQGCWYLIVIKEYKNLVFILVNDMLKYI